MSDGSRLQLTSRQLWAIFLAAFLFTAGVGLATHFSNDVDVSNELTLGASGSGMEVTITGSYHIDLSGDWAGANSVTLNTSEGNITITSTGDTDATIAAPDINGTWTNATSISASAADVTFNPGDKNASTVGGGVTAYNFTDIKVDDGVRDLRYTASSQGTIVVTTNATDGTSYGLVDPDSLEGLDVAAADSSGQITFSEVPTGTAQDARIEKLGNLTIREELSPHNTVTGCDATVRFFQTTDDSPTIVERSDGDGDGIIELAGLPVDESFVASVKCGGYHNRTVILDDLSQQKTVFLINATKNTTVNEVTYRVDDNTGDFGEGSELVVQKAINRSKYDGDPSRFSWTNIAGEEIGSTNQFTTDLIQEDRYRLRIENEEGDTRILGAHVPEENETVVLTIQSLTIDITNQSTDISVGFEKDEENDQIDFVFNDATGNTTNLNVTIYERGNESNKAHDQVHAGPFGELVIEESLTAREMNASWVVEFSGDRNGGTVDGQYLAGGQGDVSIGTIPAWVREFASVFAILLVPTVLGGSRAETAAVVATGIAAILWYIDWLPPEVSILSILLAATLAVGFKMRQRANDNIA